MPPDDEPIEGIGPRLRPALDMTGVPSYPEETKETRIRQFNGRRVRDRLTWRFGHAVSTIDGGSGSADTGTIWPAGSLLQRHPYTMLR